MYLVIGRSNAGRILVLSIAALTAAANAETVSFERVLSNPNKYHRERVTLRGVARVEGSSFVLFRDLRDAAAIAPASKAIAIKLRGNAPSYNHLDSRWINVTGIVDAKSHGMWGYPCEILLESVQPLPIAGGKESRVLVGIFRNSMLEVAHVRLFDKQNREYARFSIIPNDFNGLGVRDGRIEVSDSGGKIIVQTEIRADTSGTYFDSTERTFYYRITEKAVELASPREGRKWKEKSAEG